MTEGNKLRFRPYFKIDGIPTIKDSEIEAIYHQTVDEGFAETLFHDATINSAEEFRLHVTDPRQLFWIIYSEEDKEPIAFFWLNRVEKTHAYCHFAFFVKYWGNPITVEAGKQAMALLLTVQEGHDKPAFHTIMGMVPASNLFAIEYLKRVGLKHSLAVPNLMWSKKQQKPVAGHLMYITKKELDE
jgi:RimJ/RimL family protein N-acetyltransferase